MDFSLAKLTQYNKVLVILTCLTDLFSLCHTELCVAKWSISKSLSYRLALSYWVKRSIHKFKVQICILKRGFFALNLKCILNFYGFFAFLQKAQNDKSTLSYWGVSRSIHTKHEERTTKYRICGFFAIAQNDSSGVDFFAAATPCNLPSRYAQNDKCLRFFALHLASRFF